MALLLTTTADLRTYLGRAINKQATATDDSFRPFIELAQQTLARAVGQPLLDRLAVDQPTPALTAQDTAVKNLIKRAIAFYAYAEYLPFALGNDGANGLEESASQSAQPMRLGALAARREKTEANAAAALEAVLVYLEDNAGQVTGWKVSDAYKAAHALFIYSATSLSAVLPFAAGSYRLFLSLRPYLALVEEEQLRPLLGDTLFDALKGKLATGAPALSATEKNLLSRLRRASAWAAYHSALLHLHVVQSAGGPRVLSEFDGITTAKPATTEQIDALRREAATESRQALDVLRQFLAANASSLPGYVAPTDARPPHQPPDNSRYKSVFRMR